MKVNKPDSALEEFAPNRFIIHDIRVTPFLRGEGEIVGNRFMLQSWRREGLFGRIEQRGLWVSSLEAQIEALPRLPRLPSVGKPLVHTAPVRERWSRYDALTRQMLPCDTVSQEQHQLVTLYRGALVARRTGRSGMTYVYCRSLNGNRFEFQALDTDKAYWFMLALSHAVAPAIPVVLGAHGEYRCVLPPLPYEVKSVFERFAQVQRSTAEWSFGEDATPFVDALMRQLGIELVAQASHT